MGCICSKGASEQEKVEDSDTVEHTLKDYSVQLVAPTPSLRDDFVAEVSGLGGGGADGSVRLLSKTASRANRRSNAANDEDPNKTQVISKPGNSNHQRWATMDMGANEKKTVMSRIVSMPHGAEGEQTAAEWPSWLTSVAGDAIKGWVPRRADSFEKLDKVSSNCCFSNCLLFSAINACFNSVVVSMS